METSSVSVRDATAADLGRIAEIKVRSWAETYGSLIPAEALRPFLDRDAQLAYLRESFDAPGTVLLVAGAGSGNVVGFSLVYVEHQPEPWLESLHVHPESQGHGVGTELMRATARQIKARGFNTMRLGVVEGNAAAERFYERLGGIAYGVEPTSWANGVTHHIFRWPDLDLLVG